jgi:tetratricopeptide (TPR) repeat protein
MAKPTRCPQCGEAVEPADRYCPACGEPLPTAGKGALRRAGEEGERVARTVDDYLKAVSTFERMLHGSGPNSVRSLLSRGDALTSLGEYDAAVHAYREALKIEPTNFEGKRALARLFNRLARYREAIELCNQAQAEDPKSEEIYLIKARALLASGDFGGIVDLDTAARGEGVASAALSRVADLARRRYREVEASHAVVQEVFVIHRSTRLMAHRSRLFRPQVDSDLVAGTLRAIQDFIQFALMGVEAGAPPLDELHYGSFLVRVESRELFQAAFVVSGTPDPAMRERFGSATDHIASTFGEVLLDWDGSIDEVRGIQAYLDLTFFPELKADEMEGELDLG